MKKPVATLLALAFLAGLPSCAAQLVERSNEKRAALARRAGAVRAEQAGGRA